MAGNKIRLEHNNELQAIANAGGVKILFAFGSAVNDAFDEKTTDLDFLVLRNENSDSVQIGENMLTLWNGFGKTFNRSVDLLRLENIQNPILHETIEPTKVIFYKA